MLLSMHYISSSHILQLAIQQGAELPICIMQNVLRSSKKFNSNSILYSPGNQQLCLRLDLNMGGVSP